MGTTLDWREQLAKSERERDQAEHDKLLAEVNKLAAEQLKAFLERKSILAACGIWDWRTVFFVVYPPLAGALGAAVLCHCWQ